MSACDEVAAMAQRMVAALDPVVDQAIPATPGVVIFSGLASAMMQVVTERVQPRASQVLILKGWAEAIAQVARVLEAVEDSPPPGRLN